MFLFTILFTVSFLEVFWVDILDILLVSALLYNFYKLVRGTAALRVFVGFLLLYLVYLVVRATEMELLTVILEQFMGVGVIAAVILFQQELKKFLVMLGRTTALNENIWNIFKWRKNKDIIDWDITPVLDAMRELGGTNTGALIVVSVDDDLDAYADTGDRMDALISKRLLLSVFYKNSPLHDGALLITKGRITSARCILPVSENPKIPARLGLRHRAGVGMTEITDTLVLMVSEETGQLSLAREGKIYSNLTVKEIRQRINEFFAMKIKEKQDEPENKKSGPAKLGSESSEKGTQSTPEA